MSAEADAAAAVRDLHAFQKRVVCWVVGVIVVVAGIAFVASQPQPERDDPLPNQKLLDQIRSANQAGMP